MKFKEKLLPWLKSNWLILVLGVVALAALPTAWYFSQSMNTSYVEQVQADVTKDYDSVTKAKNAYYLQGVAGNKLLEKSTEYNSELTQWYSERWKEVQSTTGAVWDEGLKFNKGDHDLLIKEGMFPEPPELEKKVRARDLVRLVIERHAQILKDARAGMPPDPAQVAAQLAEQRAAALARIQADRGAEPDKAELERLNKELTDQRLSRYRARAGEIGVYADASVFGAIPAEVPINAPGLAEAWDLQERTWVHEDLFKAVRLVNSESSVPDAVVKRVLRISLTSTGYDPANPQFSPFEAGEEQVPTDFSRSITGRISGPGSKNKWFDMRMVQLEIVVSSKRLPAFLNALAATNFISVLDVQLSPVDANADLRGGFFYGSEHVVRANLSLETIWLREWRKGWMPLEVKRALAMDEAYKGDPNAAAGGGATPPPRRGAAPPPAGGAGGGRRGARDD